MCFDPVSLFAIPTAAASSAAASGSAAAAGSAAAGSAAAASGAAAGGAAAGGAAAGGAAAAGAAAGGAAAGAGGGATLLSNAALAATLASGALGIVQATKGVKTPASVIQDTSRETRSAAEAIMRERRKAQGFKSSILGGLDTANRPSLARQQLLGTA